MQLLEMTPKVFHAYFSEYEKAQQEKADLIDYQAWLQGRYIQIAIGSMLSKSCKYPEKSLHLLEEEEKFNEEHPDKAASIDFENWVMMFNKGKRGDG